MYRFIGILGLVMSIFFVGCGIAIIIFKPISDVFGDSVVAAYLIGLLLIAYGVFRFIRSYKSIRENKRF